MPPRHAPEDGGGRWWGAALGDVEEDGPTAPPASQSGSGRAAGGRGHSCRRWFPPAAPAGEMLRDIVCRERGRTVIGL